MTTGLLQRVRGRQRGAAATSARAELSESPRLAVHAVAVRRDCARTWRTGLALVAALTALLVALHPDWKTLTVLVAFESIGAVFTTVREISAFEDRLDVLEHLPSEAVEIERTPRRRRRRPESSRARLTTLLFLAAIVAGNAALFLEGAREWTQRLSAVVVAGLALGVVVQPMVEGVLVARWERRHPHARLFRLAEVDDADAEKQLYVSTGPVVAA
jgi:hypothetical protein